MLAKFGYALDMKVQKKSRILLYSRLPTGTNQKNGDLKKIKIQNLMNLAHFFP
jgi:hypothetical protein